MRYIELSATELEVRPDFWALYAQAFPAAEREPPSVILRSLAAGVGVALAAEEDGRIAGLATLQVLRDPPWTFLVYFAVVPELQGRGIGGEFFAHARRVGEERQRRSGRVPAGMVWEVEQPGMGATEEEGVQRERRMAFFARLGAQMLVREYVQPPLTSGEAPVPMHLLGLPASETPIPRSSLVTSIRREKYAAINGIPPDVLDLLP